MGQIVRNNEVRDQVTELRFLQWSYGHRIVILLKISLLPLEI